MRSRGDPVRVRRHGEEGRLDGGRTHDSWRHGAAGDGQPGDPSIVPGHPYHGHGGNGDGLGVAKSDFVERAARELAGNLESREQFMGRAGTLPWRYGRREHRDATPAEWAAECGFGIDRSQGAHSVMSSRGLLALPTRSDRPDAERDVFQSRDRERGALATLWRAKNESKRWAVLCILIA